MLTQDRWNDIAGIAADWTIPQRWERFTPDEHRVWDRLFERQQRQLAGRAIGAFGRGLDVLRLSRPGIPDFDELNERLFGRTGWTVVSVPGLIPDEIFFGHLSRRRFPAGNFIRSRGSLDYLEEPDVFHDVFGHVPMLMNPVIADYIQAYGIGGLRAQKLGVLQYLARVYWYTVEFGLVLQPDGLRIYGSGIASSYTESVFALDDPSPNRLRFELERVMRTRYRIDDFQEAYFVIGDFDELLELARIDFAPIYARVRNQPDLEPGDVLPGDRVISRGTGAYHATRRAAH